LLVARVATVCGIFGAGGSLGGSVLGFVAGNMIKTSGYTNVFIMIAFFAPGVRHLVATLRTKDPATRGLSRTSES
jgi:nitrate/nitrite transporter NarK